MLATEELPMSQARMVVLFDASPVQDPTPWMKQAAAGTGLFLVDLNAVAEKMANDPQAQAKVLASSKRYEDPALAPYYKQAFDRVAGDHFRVATQSVSWILFGLQPSVCVLDFDHLQDERAKGKKLGVSDKEYDALVQKFRSQIEERVNNALPRDRICVLSAGASEAQKAEEALAFLRKHVK